jgi:uncharacterized membrane protein YfcA
MDDSYSLAGFVVGAVVGLTGMGGGALMTSLLVLLFGVHPATAVGTDLLYAAVTKTAGTAVHARSGCVDWRIARRLAAGSLPAAALTLAALSQFDLRSPQLTQFVSVVLGAALLLTAVALLLRRKLLDWAQQSKVSLQDAATGRATVAVGAVLGVLVSISSVGAGALGVTALLFLYPRLAAVRIVGTDIAHAVPLTLAAGIGHWWLGSVDWALLASLLAGSLPGIWLGSRLAVKVPEGVLRPVLASMLVAIGARLTWPLLA